MSKAYQAVGDKGHKRYSQAGESEGAVAPAPRRGSKFDLVVKFCPPSRLSDNAWGEPIGRWLGDNGAPR